MLMSIHPAPVSAAWRAASAIPSGSRAGDLNDAGSRLRFPRAGESQPGLPVAARNAGRGDHFR